MSHARAVVVGALAVLALGSCSEPSGPEDIPVVARAAVNRADELAGAQIKLMYVLPSDGQDRGLDTTGTIATSVRAIQHWLSGQTGGRRLRIDSFDGGTYDITFHRLSRSDATMRAYGVFIRDTIEKDLAAAGFDVADRLYAVYYDGGAANSCGGASWPPQLNGRVGALFLKGTFASGAPPCASNPFASSPTATPGYIDFVFLHEVLHALGFVSPTAPGHTTQGHVADPRDVMYTGANPWTPSILDVGKANYFNTGGLPAGVRNFAESAYLTP